jgi:hypothetical protein
MMYLAHFFDHPRYGAPLKLGERHMLGSDGQYEKG